MKQIKRIVNSAVLKPGCVVQSLDAKEVLIKNGSRGVKFSTETAVDVSLIQKSLETFLNHAFSNQSDAAALVLHKLISAGVVVENPNSNPEIYNGEYIAYRLIDTFRETASQVWKQSSLHHRLSQPGNRSLAIGFLLEIYFHIRSANWTAAPVLSHALTPVQRNALEQFFVEEKGHGGGLVKAFRELDLDPEQVRYAVASPETELLERFFYSCAQSSPMEFAAALIVPEVEETPRTKTSSSAKSVSFMDLIEDVQQIPKSVTRFFRGHHHENDELVHDALPVQILSEYGYLNKAQVELCFRTLHFAIEAYRIFLAGVERRYGALEGSPSVLIRAPGVY